MGRKDESTTFSAAGFRRFLSNIARRPGSAPDALSRARAILDDQRRAEDEKRAAALAALDELARRQDAGDFDDSDAKALAALIHGGVATEQQFADRVAAFERVRELAQSAAKQRRLLDDLNSTADAAQEFLSNWQARVLEAKNLVAKRDSRSHSVRHVLTELEALLSEHRGLLGIEGDPRDAAQLLVQEASTALDAPPAMNIEEFAPKGKRA